jgi:3'-phosphoadenosine 5'-phosphosulfate sulfotransferase (PAPS reductase)/FAD synthetase
MFEKTKREIEIVLAKFKNPILAFSGGKDGFVVAHLCNQVFPNIRMVCETSFYFPLQIENIKEISKRHNFNVTFVSSLGDDWLYRHKEIIFSTDSKIRSFSFSARQHKTLRTFSKKYNSDIAIFGRRSDENCVPNRLYKTKNNSCFQYHPLKDWKLNDIWGYFDYIKEPRPFIYLTKFGENAGNAPFYSLKRKNMSLDECWKIINEVDTERIFFNKFK